MKRLPRIRDWALSPKLILSIGTAVLVTSLLIFTYTYTHAKRIITKNLESNASLISQKTAGSVQNRLLKIEKTPILISEFLSKKEYTDKEIIDLIKSSMLRNPEIFGIAIAYEPYSYAKKDYFHAPYVCRADSGFLTTYLGGEDYDYPLRDWYQIPKELDTAYWTEPYFDESGGNIFMTTFSTPFYTTVKGKRTFRGVVTADVSLEDLINIITKMKIYETGYCFVVSRTGTLVAHPNRDVIMHESLYSLAEERNYPAMRELANLMLEQREGKTTFDYKNLQTGKKSWFFFSPITTNGWAAGVIYPVDELMGDVTSLSRFVLLLAVCGGLLLIVLIIWIANSITQPIRRLAFAANKVSTGDFSTSLTRLERNDEVGNLNHSFIAMQSALKSYIDNLTKTTAEKHKIQSELKIAHDIQMSIIPKLFPPFPNRKEFEIYGTLIPVKEVGGDLYDFFFLDDHHLCLAIGDVSGKGVPASLLMAVTRTLLRAKIEKNMKANQIIWILNEDICKENSQKMFVTFFLAILNVSTGTLEYCNAGHNPPYLIRDGKPTQLEQFHGYPLGIRSTNYKYARTHIHKGDTLVLYTDGVTEAENKERELFDEHTLEKVLTQCAGNSPHSIVNSILKEITLYADGFEQSDDIALLALQYNGAAELTYEKPAFFKYSIQVKQNIDDLIILKTELDSLFAAWKINKEVIDDYQLVMEELMTNIIYYAFNDDEEHFINIKINFEDNKLTTQIEDNGIEFNPLDAEDPSIPTSIRGVKPGGLGIFLCKQILDKITYERVDEKNVLTFSKINK